MGCVAAFRCGGARVFTNIAITVGEARPAGNAYTAREAHSHALASAALRPALASAGGSRQYDRSVPALTFARCRGDLRMPLLLPNPADRNRHQNFGSSGSRVGDLMGWTWQKALWILAFRHFAGCWSLASGVDGEIEATAASVGWIFIRSFRAQAAVRGVFGAPDVVIVRLDRRSKKRFAGAVGWRRRAGTTGACGRFATCRVRGFGLSWNWRCGASTAVVVAA